MNAKAPASDSKALLQMLEKHYIRTANAQEYAGGLFVPECGVNGGFGSGSRADALYVGFTSASGRLLIGHELKVSRADWRRELAKIGKADFWADSCHAWYIVTTGPEIAPVEELPPGWGLMYPVRGRLKVVVKAAVDETRVPTWAAVRSIMARVDTLQRKAMLDFRAACAEEERAAADQRVEARVAAAGNTQLSPEQSRRLSVLDQIEKALGRKVDWWHGDGPTAIRPEVAAAALELALGAHTMVGHTHRLHAQQLREFADRITDGLAAYDEAHTRLAELVGGGGRG